MKYFEPYFRHERLDEENYWQFLEELPDLMEDLVRNQLWFMHDRAPAHFSVRTREYLDQNNNITEKVAVDHRHGYLGPRTSLLYIISCVDILKHCFTKHKFQLKRS